MAFVGNENADLLSFYFSTSHLHLVALCVIEENKWIELVEMFCMIMIDIRL